MGEGENRKNSMGYESNLSSKFNTDLLRSYYYTYKPLEIS